MRIAITDACIFIDLALLDLTTIFFKVEFEVHTSVDVFDELNGAQQLALSEFKDRGVLTVHNISESERQEITEKDYSKGLSPSDKTVLFLAEKLEAIVISSDKKVRLTAKTKAIEYHGMIWIFDQLVEAKLIDPPKACEALKKLITGNIIYQNNKDLINAMNKRLNEWEK